MRSTRMELRVGRYWTPVKRAVLVLVLRLFRLADGSEPVARGFSVGAIVNFFPTFGFGVLVSGVVARVMGGNTIAGVIGGAALAFFWPVLFYLNMRTGGLFFRSPIVVDEVEDLTEKTVNVLVWGQTFMTGAVINSFLSGIVLYGAVYFAHGHLRPRIISYWKSARLSTAERRYLRR